jgi:hypothetical protein
MTMKEKDKKENLQKEMQQILKEREIKIKM